MKFANYNSPIISIQRSRGIVQLAVDVNAGSGVRGTYGNGSVGHRAKDRNRSFGFVTYRSKQITIP